MRHALFYGDCVEVMRAWPGHCVDAVVTDPPYGLSFMGKGWDALGSAKQQIEWHRRWAAEALRLLKPGGYLLAFNHSRLVHYLMLGLEEAGFEIRDTIDWFYFNGFPKSLNDVAEGTGTALKPAKEPIVLAMKPFDDTYAANHAQWGTGLLNVDACRIAVVDARYAQNFGPPHARSSGVTDLAVKRGTDAHALGRWPSNVIIDELVAYELDLRCGSVGAKAPVRGTEPSAASVGRSTNRRERVPGAFHKDQGGPSRFFYCPKPTKAEREYGCEGLPYRTAGEMTDREEESDGLGSPRAGAGRTSGARNHHPTLKPVNLMRYLCRLVTPAAGLVLDPFTGSGTTGIAALREGFRFCGIERELEYLTVAAARVAAAEREGTDEEGQVEHVGRPRADAA